MNDYGNNIILASQAGCDLVLITEEGGDFPVGSKVFYYDDNDGVRQGFDTTNKQIYSFENNQNIEVDWETDLHMSDFQNMFSNSAIKSFKSLKDNKLVQANMYKSTFKDCKKLKKIDTFMIVPKPGAGYMPLLNISDFCAGANELEYVKIDFTGSGTSFFMARVFKDCTNLTELHLNMPSNFFTGIVGCTATDAFSGCKLNSHVLQQLFNSLSASTISSKVKSVDITIGYDPSSVDPNVDKPEGSELTWAEAFAAKKWTVTWEAYTEPVANAPKLLKAAKQKLYKLDEVAEEMVDMLGDFTVYVKDGKHYLMTSGDSVTAPGTDRTLLRDTEVENVVRAGSLQEAIDLLGVTLAEK